jgi:carnitine-CoA ligase
MRAEYDAIDVLASVHPDKVAMIEATGVTRTYAQLIQNARRVALRLAELDLRQGDYAAIWSFNRCDWMEVFLGCSALGVSPVPLNPEWTDEEVTLALQRSSCRVLLHEPELRDRAIGMLTAAPTIGTTLEMGSSELFREDTERTIPVVPAEAGRVLTFTSGTTGAVAKGVLQSPLGSRRRTVNLQDLWGLSASDRTLVVTPFFHGNGLSGALSALLAGGSVVFQRRFSARHFWALVDLYRPTFFFTLAPIINILLSASAGSHERSHSLRLVLSLGSAPDRMRVESRWNVRLLDWYGGSEMGGIACSRIDDDLPPGAIGRIMPGITLRILREDGSECDPGEVGEMAVPAEEIGFAGYLNDPAATQASLRGGLFFTGDLGRLDEAGFLYFVDRAKDIVRRGGENISGLEIEAVLREHPGVGDVAVVAFPEPVLGERVAVLITPNATEPTPSLDGLRAYAGPRLAHYKLPELMRVVDALPRTTNGKIRKVEARAMIASGTCVESVL